MANNEYTHIDALQFFDKAPGTAPLYEALYDAMRERLEDFSVKVQKTQITFATKYGFAFVSLPVRRVRELPDVCIIVTFGLEHRVDNPRIWQAVEPYPNRWTHHVVVADTSGIDEQLLDWIEQAWHFSQIKRRSR